MSQMDPNETWEVEVNGQLYPASFAELTEWINEGALQPDDKVRRGNLRWIEARKVPKLTAFFNAKAAGLPPPVVVTTTDGATAPVTEPAAAEQISTVTGAPVQSFRSPVTETSLYQPPPDLSHAADPNCCANHFDRPASFVCLDCSGSFCRECVKAFGSSVRVCSGCGGMCKPKTELESARRYEEFRTGSIQQGFGFGDLGSAVAYPFKFKASLIIGAIMFMLFSIGQGASSFGGIYMMSASIFAYMLSNMLAFGVLAHTVENFAHGKMGINFMPSFDDFSLWDDVVHPFLLSIGVWLSSFGPFFAVLLIGMYLVVSSVTSHLDTMRSEFEQTPGTPFYNVRNTADQSEEVKNVIANVESLNQERLDAEEDLANGNVPANTMVSDEEDFQRIQNMIAESKRQELESVVGKTRETQERETAAMLSGLLKLAAPLVVIGFITFLWGLLYFPAGCTVAGYTRSFFATLNPLVGLDTIRRLGLDYVKILFMTLLLAIAYGVISLVIAVIFMPFDMPGVGNIPARAFGSLVWFYFVIVFSCLLGFAMFKASDRLRLSR